MGDRQENWKFQNRLDYLSRSSLKVSKSASVRGDWGVARDGAPPRILQGRNGGVVRVEPRLESPHGWDGGVVMGGALPAIPP